MKSHSKFSRQEPDTKPVIDIEKSSEPDSIETALTELTELTLSEEKSASKFHTDAMAHERKSSISSVSSDSNSAIPRSSTPASVPPSLPNIENFYREVQRYEKTVNSLTTKTLNGTTPLDIKWKELHDMLEKDASKRTVNISKLFPEKNRNMLSVPFDHSRVLLPTETDNYINAAHIRVSDLFLEHLICMLCVYVCMQFWSMQTYEILFEFFKFIGTLNLFMDT